MIVDYLRLIIFSQEVYLFLSINKTVAKIGGFRIGIGTRITKKNVSYMWIVLLFVFMFQLAWYMLVAAGWMVYAIIYGMIWIIKKIIQAIAGTNKKAKSYTCSSANTIKTEVITAQGSNEAKFCKNCGADLAGGKFCSNCGSKVE